MVIKKLTPEILKKIIKEEKASMHTHADGSEEVDADKIAKTLVNKIDYVKALKVHESKLRSKLEEVSKKREELKKTILEEL